MNYERYTIPDAAPDEIGYRIIGETANRFALVRVFRGAGAAPHVFSLTASAFAVNEDGTPVISATGGTFEGHHTGSRAKSSLLVNGEYSEALAQEMKDAVIEAALLEMLGLLAAEQAFDGLAV